MSGMLLIEAGEMPRRGEAMARPAKPQPPAAAIRAEVDRVLPAYEARLRNLGRSAATFSSLTRTARHLVAWLVLNDMDVAALDIRQVAAFAAHDCRCPRAFLSAFDKRQRWQANRFLDHLLESGRASMPEEIVRGRDLVESFTASLKAQGYAESTLRTYKTACRHCIVWLYLSDLRLGEIDGGVLQRFLEHDCSCAHPQFFGRPGPFSGGGPVRQMVFRFAQFLIGRHVTADWRSPAPGSSRNRHVESFVSWLRRHRGLRPSTLQNYERSLRALLALLDDSPEDYDAAAVRKVIAERARHRSPGQVSNEATALRSYLRFLGALGLCRAGLDRAVPSIAGRSLPDLPRFVEAEAIEAIIASCDVATAIGMRDRAVLLLLARLALRAGDVANLHLGDIDWEQAALTVSGKSRQGATLPLPQEVGDAVKAYILEARPRIAGTVVFLRVPAPHRGLSRQGVGFIVRRAMERAGIDHEGLPAAHLLRHSRATNLLRGGTPLEAIGALLRHKSLRSTAIYARVDVPMLLEIAQPWPGDPE